MAPRAALLLGLLVVAAVVVVSLAPSQPRRSGTNNVPATGTVVTLAPGSEICQNEDIPEKTRAARLSVEPHGAPRASLRIVPADGPSIRARPSRAATDGTVEVALPRAPAVGAADVCVRNAGRVPLAVFGYPTSETADDATGPMRIDYYRGGSESWWSIAGVVADRFGYGKSGLLGGGALWIAVALVLAAWALAAAALWRTGAPE